MKHLIYVPAVFALGLFFHAAVSSFLRAKRAKVLSFVKKETSKL